MAPPEIDRCSDAASNSRRAERCAARAEFSTAVMAADAERKAATVATRLMTAETTAAVAAIAAT